MQKKEQKSKPRKSVSMPMVNPNAAGNDVGDLLLSVAVPADRDPQSTKEFGAFTSDLHSIAAWLKECRIETVALESTGVYWKNIYSVLTQYGFEV